MSLCAQSHAGAATVRGIANLTVGRGDETGSFEHAQMPCIAVGDARAERCISSLLVSMRETMRRAHPAMRVLGPN